MRAFRERSYTIREELFFPKVDECTANIECKLPAWINVLEKKKCELEDELRWYRGTYGRIYDYGKSCINVFGTSNDNYVSSITIVQFLTRTFSSRDKQGYGLISFVELKVVFRLFNCLLVFITSIYLDNS